jgi:uncharacterized membrane-anchored protein
MSKNYKTVLAVNLVLVLLFFAFSVIQKETLIGKGSEVLLRLAPIDPRSMMQGDYMALNYQIFDKIGYDSKSGYIVVTVGRDRIAEFVRLQSGKKVNDGELIIHYKRDLGRLTIGADNYFFQEGSAKKYEKAKYGLLKVDSDGNSILVGLCNDDGLLIE